MQDVIVISLAYILIHGFMLFLTGTFHDDWISYFHDTTTKDMEGIESGRPYYSFLIELIWNLPGYGYRILSFFTYWASCLFIYGTFLFIRGIGRREARTIALICLAVPVNDARVLLANYPYAFGMMLFFAGSFLLMKNIDRLNRVPVRIAILLLFFCSFTLNSNLVLFGVVILFLLIKFGWRKIYRYLDFIALPVAFYALNRILFPVHGAYAEYNIVTSERLKWAILAIPETVTEFCVSIIRVVASENKVFWIAAGVGIVVILISCYSSGRLTSKHFQWLSGIDNPTPSQMVEETDASGKKGALLFLLGLITLAVGLFSYVVIRQRSSIEIVGIQGRDAIQMGLGVAMMVVGGTNRRIRAALTAFILTVGVMHFNIWYLHYQTEWYRQLAYQKQIVNVQELADGGNYMVICQPETVLDDRRFYTWTGNTVAATGRQNVLMLNDEEDVSMLKDSSKMTSILSHYPMFRKYKADHSSVDGSILFSAEITRQETVRLKFLEIFNPERFEKEINQIGAMEFSP